MESYTIEELERYDGKEGRAAYVAVSGVVYDVTKVAMWESGEHFFSHSAGCDLTDALSSAPHGEEVLAGLKKIGVLAPAAAT